MAKVDDFYIGNTHVMFYDDYVVKDPEKIAEIERNLSEIAYRIHLRKAIEELEKQEKNKAENQQDN